VYALAQDAEPRPVKATVDDVMGGIARFLLNVVATLPASIPFLIISNWNVALRVSNVVTILMMFGQLLGAICGREPLEDRTGGSDPRRNAGSHSCGAGRLIVVRCGSANRELPVIRRRSSDVPSLTRGHRS